MTANADPKPAPPLKRFALLALAVAGAVALYVFGGDYLSFDALRRNQEALIAWRDANYLISALTFMAIYAAATALSFPGGLVLTLAGGFLFGAFMGAALSVVGATAGALAIFSIVKAGLGDALRARAGPFLKKAEAGFREDQVSYLLVLRLVPAVPFFIANILPAFLGASFIAYAWTTFIGIVPGGFVYASVGAGLGAVFAAGGSPDLGLIFEPQILLPLLGVAALAALPPAIKRLRGRRRAGR